MKKLVIVSMIFFICGTAGTALGQKVGKELREAVDRVDDASSVVNTIMRAGDKSIPSDLLRRAEAIVVFPGTLKAAFIVGGQGGKGVAIRRTADGWSAPAFLKLGGGSFGPQIGGSETDYILLIMNDSGLKHLLQDKFELGAEGSVAAGPVGRTAAASTDARLDAEILSYSRTKGLFAGLSLKGVVITQDEDMNQAVYQKSAREILGQPVMRSADAPQTLQRFADTVSTYSR